MQCNKLALIFFLINVVEKHFESIVSYSFCVTQGLLASLFGASCAQCQALEAYELLSLAIMALLGGCVLVLVLGECGNHEQLVHCCKKLHD